MDLKIGSFLKALGILVGLVLGSGIVSEEIIAKIVGALTVLATVGWDIYETMRLAKQGVVSTEPTTNIADPRTPEKLAAEEKAKAKKSA